MVTIVAAGGGGSAAAIGVVVAVLLVGLLVAKETMTSVPDPRGRLIGRVLDVALVPLALAFVFTVVARFLP
jgi:hypothetical protein